MNYGDVYKRVFGKEEYFTLTMGGNTYALGEYVEAWWQYEIPQIDVLGSEIPAQGTRSFRGGILIRRTFTTDTNLLAFQALSSGDVPETTITNALENLERASPITKTWTIKSRLNHHRHITRKGGFVVQEISGPLTALPTEA